MNQVDPPTFGDELRRLRRDRGMSLRDFARMANHSKTVIWEWETSRKHIAADAAARLDALLDADGALVAAHNKPAILPACIEVDRLRCAAIRPRAVDRATVDALHGVLAHMRRLEDARGAAPLIPAITGPYRLVGTLADEARGVIRTDVVNLAGQWAQFGGWLHASAGQHAKAKALYAQALEYATEAGSVDLTATALSMRGNLAWMARQPGPVVGLSAAAGALPASPGVRAMAAQQEARGHAVLGNPDLVDQRLDEAATLMDEAEQHPDREPPWIYFYSPGYLAMQRGLAYRILGRHEDAIAQLTAGLTATDDTVRQSEFVAVYVLHLIEVHHELGNDDEAHKLLEQVRGVSAETGSSRLAADVDRLARHLSL